MAIDLNQYRKTATSTGQIDLSKYAKNQPTQSPTSKQPFYQKVVNATGFSKTADTLGSLFARASASSETKQYIPKPSTREVAGAALNIGSTVMPIGGLAKTAAKAVGMKAASVIAPAAAGFAYDAGQDLEQGGSIGQALTPGIGTALGAAIPGGHLATRAVKSYAADNVAPRLINSLIKPLSKQFSYGKNPGRAVAEMGITGNSLEELATNIAQARQSVGQNLRQLGTQVQLQQPLNLEPLLQPFDDAITKAVNNNDQALLNRLNETKTALTAIFRQRDGKITPTGSRVLSNLNYEQALDFKQRIGDLTKWTGQRTEDETVNGALTRAYGMVKQSLDDAASKANPEQAAQLRKLNEQYADLTSAEIATKYRDVLSSRQNLINLPGKIGLIGSAISAPFTGGVTALVGAGASIAADKVLSSPAIKTRAASFLSKMKPKDLKPFTSPGDLIIRGGKDAAKQIAENPRPEAGFFNLFGKAGSLAQQRRDIIQQRDRLIRQGMSESNPRIKALDKAYADIVRQTRKQP